MKLRAAAGPALLLAGLGALVAVLSPFHNTPVQDDWDYARTVQLLLRTGSFQRSEIAQATEVFSALWGSAFAKLLGFSFDSLRFSTLVLSAAALLIFYALLGELGFGGARRIAGAATLLACPLFVFLSFSFMTDVPALACLLAALYCYVRALHRSDLRLAFAGSLFVSLAFLTRQLGLVSALAVASYFFMRPPNRNASREFAEAGLGRDAGQPFETAGEFIETATAVARGQPWQTAGESTVADTAPAHDRPLQSAGETAGAGPSSLAASDPPASPAGPKGAPAGSRATARVAPTYSNEPTRSFPDLPRLRWVTASAALPVIVALAYAIWSAQSGGVTWANSRLTLGGTLDFVRDPQTPGVLIRRIVEDCMTLAVYLLPLWLLFLPAVRRPASYAHAFRAARSTRSAAQVTAENAALQDDGSVLPSGLRLQAEGAAVQDARRALPRLRAQRADTRLGRGLILGAVLTAGLFVFTAFRLAQRGEYLPYLTDVVTRQGLRPYLAYFAYAGGAFRPDILPLPFWIALTVLGCVGGWGLAMLALRRFSWPDGWQFSGRSRDRVRSAEPRTSQQAAASHGHDHVPRVLGGGALDRRESKGNISPQAGERKVSNLPSYSRTGPTRLDVHNGERRTGAQSPASGTGLVYWSAFCLVVPTLLFPEFYERFLLPFLPVAIILLLDAGRRTRPAPPLAAAGVVVLALCSILLMKDYWGWMDVRWPLAQSVVAGGVPLPKLDGGYEWDGWNLYDQSMELTRQKQLPMQITPWAYVIDPQYMLAFAPLAGYHVAREVRFDSPFGAAAGRFYMLERN